jgi:hypothetical protein
VSLPLQSSGLAVGGDVQSRATDVLKRGITKEQAKLIAKECAPAAEIANVSQECAKAIYYVIRFGHSCGEPGLLCFEVSHVSGLDYSGYIEIVDDRSETSLCDAAPDHVCMRVGVATPALLDQVVAATLPTTSSEVTTSTEMTISTEVTTETTPTSVSDTSSSTPEATSAPTASS